MLYRFEGLGGDEDDRRGGLRGGRRREGSVRRRRLSGEGLGHVRADELRQAEEKSAVGFIWTKEGWM